MRFYGCPAEEGGSGKTFMARAGVFDDLDAALSWHPHVYTGIFPAGSLANIQAYPRKADPARRSCRAGVFDDLDAALSWHPHVYTGIFPAGSLATQAAFAGKASHASPHLGRSALDAVELMNVGVNYLREHMRSARALRGDKHGRPVAERGAGQCGSAVPRARGPQRSGGRAVRAREERARCGDDDRLPARDRVRQSLLEPAGKCRAELMYRHLQSIGTAGFDADDAALADAYQRQTLTAQDIETSSRSLNQAAARSEGVVRRDRSVRRQGPPDLRIDRRRRRELGHADRAMPYELLRIRHAAALVAVGRARQDTARTQGMLLAAKTMAATAIDLFGAPDTLAQAKAELLERRGGRPYVCPIPDDGGCRSAAERDVPGRLRGHASAGGAARLTSTRFGRTPVW